MINLRLGDCVEQMIEIPDSSIDLILTSPPYDSLRSYASGSTFDFEGVAEQCKRLLKPGGVLVWVVGDQTIDGSESGTSFRQALHFKTIGLKLWDTMIYQKGCFLPLNHPRYEQAFEFMFVLSKGKPRTTNILTVPCKCPGLSRKSTYRHGGHGVDDRILFTSSGNPTKETKLRTNIWTYATNRVDRGHPAMFPLQLAIDHILSWTNPGGVVLDPFCGSGTVGEACLGLDRDFIGIDISPEYLEIAERRIAAARAKHPLFPCPG